MDTTNPMSYKFGETSFSNISFQNKRKATEEIDNVAKKIKDELEAIKIEMIKKDKIISDLESKIKELNDSNSEIKQKFKDIKTFIITQLTKLLLLKETRHIGYGHERTFVEFRDIQLVFIKISEKFKSLFF